MVRPDGSDARLVAGAAPGTALLAEGRSRGWTADGALVLTETHTASQVLRIRPETGERMVLHEGRLTTAIDVTRRRELLVDPARSARRRATSSWSREPPRAP